MLRKWFNQGETLRADFKQALTNTLARVGIKAEGVRRRKVLWAADLVFKALHEMWMRERWKVMRKGEEFEWSGYLGGG